MKTLGKRKQPVFHGTKNKWGQDSYKRAVMWIPSRREFVHFVMKEEDVNNW